MPRTEDTEVCVVDYVCSSCGLVRRANSEDIPSMCGVCERNKSSTTYFHRSYGRMYDNHIHTSLIKRPLLNDTNFFTSNTEYYTNFIDCEEDSFD